MTEPTAPDPAYLNAIAADTRARMQTAIPEESPRRGAPQELADAVEKRVTALQGDLARIVHTLHANPETAYQEHASAAVLADVLGRHGIDATVGVHGVGTAIRAELNGTSPGPTVAVLSEYDALPGIGHACGHNVIAATGVGAFLALASVRDRLPGRVVFLGTPAEEGHSGKEIMARNGAFDGVDAAIMVHPYGYDLADQAWLGRRLLTITFTGVAAHASAQPFMGRNALDAASLTYQGIGLLRQQLPPSDRVHANIVEGGQSPNIIPNRAVLKLYARSRLPETLKDLSRRLDDIARGAALMTGTAVDLAWDEHPPSLPIRTNNALTGRWVKAQQGRGRAPLPAGVVSDTLAASTDFGNVSYRIPGIHPLISIAGSGTALHTREFAAAANTEAAEKGAYDGAAGLALTALDYLCDPELQRAVAAEFEAQGGPVDVPAYFD
ncbi:M20 family metallopeptidase [Arthrobacter tumbae]|uniref:M20 family metallopeptidase n=1 Tax=Arthrobacter tumbae TaxID=163874 RepID=UPI0019599F42|nr:M20 family metallopeptidase [Arthrobacter tumbae]MBM7780775.1 amidohydrolase [Arthrobacter tumbae]